PLEHGPRRLLRDADCLRQLRARNAHSRRFEQIHRIEPLVQRNLRPLEYRVRADGKIEQAGVAAVIAALAGADTLALSAGRANGPIWPAAGLEIVPRTLLIGEKLEKLECADRGLTHCRATRPQDHADR